MSDSSTELKALEAAALAIFPLIWDQKPVTEAKMGDCRDITRTAVETYLRQAAMSHEERAREFYEQGLFVHEAAIPIVAQAFATVASAQREADAKIAETWEKEVQNIPMATSAEFDDGMRAGCSTVAAAIRKGTGDE